MQRGAGALNDIRNLMDNLHTQMEYKEFDPAARAASAGAGGWAILQRVGRAVPPIPSPQASPEAAAAAQPAPQSTRAPVRGLRRPKRSLLNRYASEAEADADESRRLPLAEVFARLTQSAG